MLNAVDDHSQELRRRFKEVKARVTWILLAAWTVTAVAGWLVVTFTDDGLYNLPWVIGPPAVITLMGYAVWLDWKDTVEKRETFAGLGFRVAEPEENRDIAAGIEAMFDARANVTVLGTRVILPDVQCWMAEVTEILDRDAEGTVSRTSNVCLFENTGEQPYSPHPFQLEPHNSVARMLFRSLSTWFSRSETAGFHVWYNAVSDEESGLPEFLTPDLREWLGRHSRWSKMRPWTVVDFGKRTLIYRAGTVYEIEKYRQLVSEMQVFAGLRAQAGMTINGPHVKDSERPFSDADSFSQEGQVAKIERDQLLDQVPVRDLTPYWRERTRVEPFLLMALSVVGSIVIFSSDQIIKFIQQVTGVVLDQGWGIVITAGLAAVIVFIAARDHWWLHRRNRRLLKIGEMASGTVDHVIDRDGNRSQDASLYRVQVTYSALEATRTAKCCVFVSDARAAALTRFAEVDRQVVVLFDPANPENIVLPELLAFCG
jgi:hypothetical protein